MPATKLLEFVYFYSVHGIIPSNLLQNEMTMDLILDLNSVVNILSKTGTQSWRGYKTIHSHLIESQFYSETFLSSIYLEGLP